MAVPGTLPGGGLAREEVARRDLGTTAVSPAVARALAIVFLGSILCVPLAEIFNARRSSEDHPWSRLARTLNEIAWALPPSTGVWDHIVSTNRTVLGAIENFERGIEDQSLIGRALRPPAQALMTGWLDAGNERVYPGRDGWLFYRPDVEYITGRGFLEPDRLRRRRESAPEWTMPPQPDPRAAIVQLNRDLAARGVALVVMPTPVKPAIEADKLSERYAGTASALHNPSYRQLIDHLEREGVLVFDPSDLLMTARQDAAQYLATDTHWRPEAMEAIAAQLSDFITARVGLPEAADPEYIIEQLEAKNVGDTARMLDLAADSTLYSAETVWIRRVLHQDGSPWRPSRSADVLLLGDSFTNIYSLESMGWGTAAGLAEHLSFSLRRAVDRIVQNDDGAYATRAMLQRDHRRLDGKRVVVYQFAVRELSDGDWKVLPLSRDVQ